MTGRLYIVATPIGNLQDITLRALEVLKSADIIACEDTRRTVKLLNRFGIGKPLLSYFRHNQRKRAGEIIAWLKEGKSIVLVTDAGTPAVSDPGAELVREARTAGADVISIPGPSSMTALLSVSGYDGPVLFFGYLPPKSAARRRLLKSLDSLKGTALLLFEGPHRVAKTLNDILATLGDRNLVLGREMTKIHEEIKETTVTALSTSLKNRPPRGEYTLLVLPWESR